MLYPPLVMCVVMADGCDGVGEGRAVPTTVPTTFLDPVAAGAPSLGSENTWFPLTGCVICSFSGALVGLTEPFTWWETGGGAWWVEAVLVLTT